MKSLYRICASHSLLPRSLQIEVCYDLLSLAHFRGGFADVWKGNHRGRVVAAKVLRICASDDLQMITRVSHQRYPHFQYSCLHADNLCSVSARSSWRGKPLLIQMCYHC